MNTLSTFAALVTAALIAIAAGSAWSEEATPYGSAVQITAPATGVAPGWYPPPNRGGYARSWQRPPQWSMPPRGYGQRRPYYPPRGRYRAVPAAPEAETSPLSAERKQTQEQLTARTSEPEMSRTLLEQCRGKLQHSLETERTLSEQAAQITGEQQALQARVTELTAALKQHRQQITNNQEQHRTLTVERDRLRGDLASRDRQLATLQAELQAARDALQQAQAETGNSGRQLGETRTQAERFNQQLARLKARLEQQKIASLETEQNRTEVHDSLRSDLAHRDEQLAGVQAELQAARDALEQARAETVTSGRLLGEARAQAETFDQQLSELRAQLESRKTALLDTEQSLAAAIAERDGLQADMADCSRELTQARATEVIVPTAPAGPDQAVEPAASEEPDAGTAETAAPQDATTDTDADGIPDSGDLCPGSQPDTAMDSTGCAAGVAINLKGVNFPYDSHELTDKARRILDPVAAIIIQHPELRLEVAGHTDATGDPDYNQWLSMQRAEAVRDYLVAQGVNPGHIGAAGYGGQRPIADNATLEGLQQNRRVELRILE